MAETLFGAAPGAGSASAEIIDVTDFAREVIERSQQIPVLVDFWADWCGPCHSMAPILEQLASDNAGRVKVVKLDVDASPQTPAALGIRSIPTLMLFRDGELAATHTGTAPKAMLTAFLDAKLAA